MPTLRFYAGSDYGITFDTWIGEAVPNVSHSDEGELRVSSKRGDRARALIRFQGYIGDTDGQVPPNASILTARLLIRTTADGATQAGGSVYTYLMQREWDTESTWTIAEPGITWSVPGADGVSTVPPDRSGVPLATEPLHPNTGTTTWVIDITRAVRGWVSRHVTSTNEQTVSKVDFGVILVMSDDVEDEATFYSSRAFSDPGGIILAPILEVVYEKSAHLEIDLSQSGIIVSDTYIDEELPTTSFGSASVLKYSNDVDGDVPMDIFKESFLISDWYHATFESVSSNFTELFLIGDWYHITFAPVSSNFAESFLINDWSATG